MKEEEAIEKLSEMVSDKRLQHILGVKQTAIELAKKYGVDLEKASWAGLLHDCAKGLSNNLLLQRAREFDIVIDDICKKVPELLHAPVGAEIARREFNITDQRILDAIAWHTLGNENMTDLAKVVFLADYIEPTRKCEAINNLRNKINNKKLNDAVRIACENTIKYHLSQTEIIHPQSIITRNSLL